MNHEQARELLHDFVDDDLKTADRSELEQHLDSCEDCRAELAYLRGLRQRAASLRQPVAPPYDLWPGIAATIDRTAAPGPATIRGAEAASGSGRQVARRRILGLPAVPAHLAAAAVAVGILLTAAALWRTGPDLALVAPAERAATDTHLAGLPAEFSATGASATAEALATITRPDPRERIAFATLTGPEPTGPAGDAFRFGLAQLDQAIADLEAAWLADPGNANRAYQLATAYQDRALLQTRADRLSVQL